MRNFLKNIFFIFSIFITQNSFAANHNLTKIPDSADSGRFEKDFKNRKIPLTPKKYSPIKSILEENIPKNAERIKFVLGDIEIEGSTVFDQNDFKTFYQQNIGTEINLYTIWEIADKITKLYHSKGYFLSIATVPEQEISGNGIVKIKIIEGYVGNLEFDENAKKIKLTKKLIQKLQSEKPTNIKTLESLMLRLNDLPSMSFESIIEPLDGENGAVKLSIVSKRKQDMGQVTFDNYNSKYIGSNEMIFQYVKSLTKNSKTSVSYITSLPLDYLEYISVNNDITILPDIVLGFYGSKAQTELGASLKQLEITSNSKSFGINLSKQFIRQRKENFSMKIGLDGRNIESDILNEPLARDHIREAILNFAYDGEDRLSGYNYFNIDLVSGISGLGASKKSDNNLSRKKVDSNYKRLEFSLNRFQTLGYSFMMVNSVAGQLSSGRLYSSSRFGYGGQLFGKAYDQSEITGDRGINGGIELRYISLPSFKKTNLAPFLYYDIGRIWNANEDPRILSSIGYGIRAESSNGFTASFIIANPIEERSKLSSYAELRDEKYLFQISYRF